MCGILGAFDLPATFNVAARLDLIRHRGPDGSGVAKQGPSVHGHVRLALLDLSDASSQPFKLGDGLLTYVGEIWNFRAVRSELEAAGRIFRTTGDTEVVAAALDEWGEAALPKLDGMFTLAWSKGACHILARDRFGKIPLYVHRRASGGFAWASERKGLGKEYLATALPPGTVLDLVTGKLRQWYSLPLKSTTNRPLAGLLEDGVEARLVADAPLCCLISGGLDSSLILTLAKRYKPDVVAYTAVLDDASADLKAARRLCRELSVPLVEVPIAPPTPARLTEAVRAIEIISKAQVEIAALCIPLAGAIASDGFKACLSGEAADELFGGYGSMCIKGSSANDAEWRAIRVHQLNKMARGNFVRTNKAFMAAGVECRLPFMHRPLVEIALAMTKAESPPGKRALKRAAEGIIPKWIISREKDTFQGGAGMSDACAKVLADPAAFYRSEVRHHFGLLAQE